MKKKKAVWIEVGRKPACLAEAIRTIHFNCFIHLKKASRTWSFCNPLLREMTSQSSTLLLQSLKAQGWYGDSCLVWGACCNWFPSMGHIKSRQTGKRWWYSVAWWSWDQYVIQLAQLNSFWGEIAGFCWQCFSCMDAISGDGLYAMLWHLLLLKWITERSAVQPVQHGMCCLALWLSKGHLTGINAGRKRSWQELAPDSACGLFWVLFSSLLGSLYLCVQHALSDTTAACPQHWAVWADHKIVTDLNTKLLCDIPSGLECKIQSWKVTYEDS